jgi:hypothetical protein
MFKLLSVTDGLRVCYRSSGLRLGPINFHLSNKAVLISAPDLPLVFLLLQLLIAVLLLKLSALVSRGKIEIPAFELEVAKKLFPVVFVNIAG